MARPKNPIREAAIAAGEKYFYGTVCKKCGGEQRFVSSGSCVPCDTIRVRKEYHDDPVERQRRLDAYKRWSSDPTVFAKLRIYYREYQKANPDKVNEASRIRNAREARQTPPWADLNAINEIYMNCPRGYQVDHIIPIAGRTVSGLHIAENLRYLTPKENKGKGNSWDWETQT